MQVSFKDLAGKHLAYFMTGSTSLPIILFVYICKFLVMKKGGAAKYSGISILVLSCKLKLVLNYMIRSICFSAGKYLRETRTFLL